MVREENQEKRGARVTKVTWVRPGQSVSRESQGLLDRKVPEEPLGRWVLQEEWANKEIQVYKVTRVTWDRMAQWDLPGQKVKRVNRGRTARWKVPQVPKVTEVLLETEEIEESRVTLDTLVI